MEKLQGKFYSYSCLTEHPGVREISGVKGDRLYLDIFCPKKKKKAGIGSSQRRVWLAASATDFHMVEIPRNKLTCNNLGNCLLLRRLECFDSSIFEEYKGMLKMNKEAQKLSNGINVGFLTGEKTAVEVLRLPQGKRKVQVVGFFVCL